jgi:hypothetical protein
MWSSQALSTWPLWLRRIRRWTYFLWRRWWCCSRWAGSQGRNDDFAEKFLAHLVFGWPVLLCCASGEVHHFSVFGAQIMTIGAAIGYALSAFGIGYAAGAIQRVIRRSIEILD